jgi:hypothetical protein
MKAKQLQHLEALEPADVYEKEKYVSSTNRYSTKTEEYHDFRGCWKIIWEQY